MKEIETPCLNSPLKGHSSMWAVDIFLSSLLPLCLKYSTIHLGQRYFLPLVGCEFLFVGFFFHSKQRKDAVNKEHYHDWYSSPKWWTFRFLAFCCIYFISILKWILSVIYIFVDEMLFPFNWIWSRNLNTVTEQQIIRFTSFFSLFLLIYLFYFVNFPEKIYVF